MVKRRNNRKHQQSGQAVLEYILMMSLVVSLFMMISKAMVKMKFAEMLMRPITETYARAYQYGHPKAKGFDDGGPDMHPRVTSGNNFRLFLNPNQ